MILKSTARFPGSESIMAFRRTKTRIRDTWFVYVSAILAWARRMFETAFLPIRNCFLSVKFSSLWSSVCSTSSRTNSTPCLFRKNEAMRSAKFRTMSLFHIAIQMALTAQSFTVGWIKSQIGASFTRLKMGTINHVGVPALFTLAIGAHKYRKFPSPFQFFCGRVVAERDNIFIVHVLDYSTIAR